MEVLLLGIYCFFVWLIFIKLKWLPWNITTQVIVVIIPIVGLATLILLLNVFAPSSADVRVYKYVVPIVSQVKGRVLEVPVEEGNRLVRKGEVLFRIDPRPFDAALKQAEANALRDAAARDQARSQEKRYQELLQKNFVSKEAYAQIATNAQVAEATARASEAMLENARINLEYCTIVSPIDGFVGKVLPQVGNLVKANDANPDRKSTRLNSSHLKLSRMPSSA